MTLATIVLRIYTFQWHHEQNMNLILRADVKKITGKTRHFLGTVIEGQPVPVSPFPVPKWVGISRESGGFFLLYFDKNDVFITDGWHESLEGAKKQANFEFEITENDWQFTDEHVD
jgi:hypothetical protein